jgi:hypothetical protein
VTLKIFSAFAAAAAPIVEGCQLSIRNRFNGHVAIFQIGTG